MSNKDMVFELMKNNNGILESKLAVKAGIDNKVLQRLSKVGEIERVQKAFIFILIILKRKNEINISIW